MKPLAQTSCAGLFTALAGCATVDSTSYYVDLPSQPVGTDVHNTEANAASGGIGSTSNVAIITSQGNQSEYDDYGNEGTEIGEVSIDAGNSYSSEVEIETVNYVDTYVDYNANAENTAYVDNTDNDASGGNISADAASNNFTFFAAPSPYDEPVCVQRDSTLKLNFLTGTTDETSSYTRADDSHCDHINIDMYKHPEEYTFWMEGYACHATTNPPADLEDGMSYTSALHSVDPALCALYEKLELNQ